MAASLVVLYTNSSQSMAECVAALQPVLHHAPLSDSVETKVRCTCMSMAHSQCSITQSCVWSHLKARLNSANSVTLCNIHTTLVVGENY